MQRMMRFFPSRTVFTAVVVSLAVGGVGSATAASLITGKQIKNGSIQLADLSKSARKKLRGKSGSRGAQGAQGSQGAQGAQGAKGDTGADGPFPDGNLPSGKTLRGYYYVGDTAAAAGYFATDSISFVYKLSSAPTAHFIRTTDGPVAECPGTAAEPEAEEGHLCVYEGSSSNAGARNTNTFSGFDGTSLNIGAGIFIRSAAAGDFSTRGTWAVTAP